MPDDQAHLTHLRLVQPGQIDLQMAARLLADASSWLGTPVPSTHSDLRRYLTDLSLPLRSHSPGIVFKKAAFVDVGVITSSLGSCEVEIGWRSSSLAPLFPVFAGRLSLTPSGLSLDGYYAPPGGDLGAVLDRAFLNIAARGTARWLLERISGALRGSESPD
jgi:hypothetical protein